MHVEMRLLPGGKGNMQGHAWAIVATNDLGDKKVLQAGWSAEFVRAELEGSSAAAGWHAAFASGLRV